MDFLCYCVFPHLWLNIYSENQLRPRRLVFLQTRGRWRSWAEGGGQLWKGVKGSCLVTNVLFSRLLRLALVTFLQFDMLNRWICNVVSRMKTNEHRKQLMESHQIWPPNSFRCLQRSIREISHLSGSPFPLSSTIPRETFIPSPWSLSSLSSFTFLEFQTQRTRNP